MSAAALASALAEAGLPCAIEARERLAVVVADASGAAAMGSAAARELAVRLAAAHGFTHVALELPPPGAPEGGAEPPDASLPRA